ncbi:MAG TPA: NrfD/PsrC family molybdoenzyme membrane anchor subunit [Methylomirabilota bacterium]|jgi:molybdopterin-containing oxidoreductase family membrane subunit|nr:NrfD/PsrC family molybdoenzyme membrane anchor subunit [Methylomirabilota bacterium]
MGTLLAFFADSLRQLFRGGRLYWSWVGGLGLVVLLGVSFYWRQLQQGLITTGMSDQVSWGAYIANFTYLVGIAAAAVMLVIPAYVFHRDDVKHVVLIGEGIAVAAVIMSVLFVVVDLGRPDRMWHMIPWVGRLHFPASLLAWDIVVLTGYLGLNLAIPFYILFSRYRGREPRARLYFPAVLLSIVWAISIHTVTAFLFSSNVARPFWHTAVLGPRFLASAFTAGPALIVLALQIIDRNTPFKVQSSVIDLMALITTVALQINLFLVGAEIFTDFYFRTEHVAAATYLYLGLNGANRLVPWIWIAILLDGAAAIMLTLHPLRKRRVFLSIACALAIVGVWIEKGMGLVVPGFVPTPLGEVFEYSPHWGEVFVSLGIWALGMLVFTLLAKVAIPIELGELRRSAAPRPSAAPGP